MRSTVSFEVFGSPWSSDADQPLLADSPLDLALEDDEALQREFVEDIYRDLGVGD